MDVGPAQSADISDVTDATESGRSALGASGGRGPPAPGGIAPRGAATALSKESQADGDRLDYTQFDPETGYSGHNLFNVRGGRDDDEADAAYAAVDERMARRRKRQREVTAAELKDLEGLNARPKIADVLAPYKAGLGTVTEDQWDAIPEVGNHSLKYKRRRKTSRQCLPASSKRRDEQQWVRQGQAGSESAALGSSITVDVRVRWRQLRTLVCEVQHRRRWSATRQSGTMSVIGGHKSVDPKGYLTSMAGLDGNGMEGGSSATGGDVGSIGDISKNRRLFRSLRESNPKQFELDLRCKAGGVGRKMSEARRIIRGACESCPLDEAVWLEALRLHPPEEAREIAGRGLRRLPKSVKLWLATAELEVVGVAATSGDTGAAAESLRQTAKTRQKMVLRRALETIPNSVKLWERAISLEDEDEDARIMLSRAVECVPSSVHVRH